MSCRVTVPPAAFTPPCECRTRTGIWWWRATCRPSPADLLRELLRRAETAERNCVAATGPYGQPEPLCAVYHRRCLPALTRAIRDKRLRMRDFVKEIGAVWVPVDTSALANVNTPAEWAEFEAKLPDLGL